MRQVKQRFNISVGLCGTTDAGHLNAGAANPPGYAAAVRQFLGGLNFEVDELWTDFEVKGIGEGTTRRANEMHALMQHIRPTFRYAGCEPRDPPCERAATVSPPPLVFSAFALQAARAEQLAAPPPRPRPLSAFARGGRPLGELLRLRGWRARRGRAGRQHLLVDPDQLRLLCVGSHSLSAACNGFVYT